MLVVVEPGAKTPIRGILSGPIFKPTKLDLTEAQIKRVILLGGKVTGFADDGSKVNVELKKCKVDGKLVDVISTGKTPAGNTVDMYTEDKNADGIKADVVVDVRSAEAQDQRPVHKTKAQRREEARLAREAAQREAKAKAEAERLAKEEAERLTVEEEVEATETEVVEDCAIDEEEAAKEAAEILED